MAAKKMCFEKMKRLKLHEMARNHIFPFWVGVGGPSICDYNNDGMVTQISRFGVRGLKSLGVGCAVSSYVDSFTSAPIEKQQETRWNVARCNPVKQPTYGTRTAKGVWPRQDPSPFCELGWYMYVCQSCVLHEVAAQAF